MEQHEEVEPREVVSRLVVQLLEVVEDADVLPRERIEAARVLSDVVSKGFPLVGLVEPPGRKEEPKT